MWAPAPLGSARWWARNAEASAGLGTVGWPCRSMTQSVVVQVGQCGNQIGCCFWDLALREHAAVNKKGIYDEAISSFFRNVDTRVVGDGGSISKGKICSLKARAVLTDMEEGVVNEILQGPLRDVFDSKQLITDISG